MAAWLQQRWEGENAEPAATLLEHAAGCLGCAARLQAALSLCAGPERRPASPPELARRIAERLDRQPVHPPLPTRVRAPQRATLRVVRWALLPLAAALAAAIGTAALFGAFAPREAATVVVRFQLAAPEAREVSLVADWNRWDPAAQRLTDPDGDGVWEIQIPLRRGQEHQYQFLVDGSLWVPDPLAPLKVQDGLGGTNSVLQI